MQDINYFDLVALAQLLVDVLTFEVDNHRAYPIVPH